MVEFIQSNHKKKGGGVVVMHIQRFSKGCRNKKTHKEEKSAHPKKLQKAKNYNSK